MTKQEAIDHYLGHPFEELYLVTNRLENSIAGTEQWFLYPDLEHATGWINSCVEHFKTAEPYYRELERDQDGECINKLVFEHHALGQMLTITETFITEHFVLGA